MKAGKFNQILVVAFLLVISTISLKAQVFVPQNMMSNPVLQRAMENRNMTTTAISGLIRSDMLRNSAKGTKGKRNNSSVPASPTSFKASSANSMVKSLVNQSGGNPAEQKQAEEVFYKCLEIYWDTAKKTGFPSNDLAYGFLHFAANNYHVYHDVFSNEAATRWGYYDESVDPLYIEMSEQKVVFRQFQELLGSSPQVKKLTDKEKQQFAEMLAIMTNMPFQLYSEGLKTKDRKLIEKAREIAKANLETLFDTPAENIVINNQGISLKSK